MEAQWPSSPVPSPIQSNDGPPFFCVMTDEESSWRRAAQQGASGMHGRERQRTVFSYAAAAAFGSPPLSRPFTSWQFSSGIPTTLMKSSLSPL